MTRYIVFERVEGGSCWTIAMQSTDERDPTHQDTPAQFHTADAAVSWVTNVHSKRRGWWGGKPDQRPMQAHIATIDLPG